MKSIRQLSSFKNRRKSGLNRFRIKSVRRCLVIAHESDNENGRRSIVAIQTYNDGDNDSGNRDHVCRTDPLTGARPMNDRKSLVALFQREPSRSQKRKLCDALLCCDSISNRDDTVLVFADYLIGVSTYSVAPIKFLLHSIASGLRAAGEHYRRNQGDSKKSGCGLSTPHGCPVPPMRIRSI